jgi:hypothetical protein
LWESDDAGSTWTYTYDPFPDTGTQQLYDATFTAQRTLLLATAMGIARRPGPGRGALSFPDSARGAPTRAITLSANRIWARTDSSLLFSDDDGITWTVKKLPPNVNIPKPPNVKVKNLNLYTVPHYDNTSCSDSTHCHGNGNDRTTLAAFDDVAYLAFEVSDVSGHRLDTGSPLLIFDAASDTFVAQLTVANDGRGLGGTRFVRAYLLRCPALQDSIGERRQLFYGTGQEIQQALGENADRTIEFDVPVDTNWPGPEDPANPRRPIHSDLWAFHLDPDFCPPGNSNVWLGGDGGVYRSSGTSLSLRQLDWVTHDEGLFTHNIHQLGVIQGDASGEVTIAYGTHDNDAWWHQGTNDWQRGVSLGDVLTCVADSRNHAKILFTRGLRDQQASISDLRGGGEYAFEINRRGVDIATVQTLTSEQDYYPDLDLLMLTKLPVTDHDGNNLPLDYFTPGDPSNTMLLLRNSSFSQHADGPRNRFAGWTAIGANLPGGAKRVYVAGGHASSRYFLVAEDAGGTENLYRGVHTGGHLTGWTPIFTGLLSTGNGDYGTSERPRHGPAFVNPYDSDVVFVIGADRGHPEGAVFVSRNSGDSFVVDEALTSLLSNTGRYRLGIFTATPQAEEVGSRFHGGTMFNPSQIAFSPAGPSFVVACSPVTGVFFANMAQGCGSTSTSQTAPAWRSLGQFLPNPFGYISDARFDGGRLYVATEGRGLLVVDDPFIAPTAAYFEIILGAGGKLAMLLDTTGTPVPWGSVRMNIARIVANPAGVIPFEQRIPTFDGWTRTDEGGLVNTPVQMGRGRYLVHLRFVGDGVLAPYETSFVLNL